MRGLNSNLADGESMQESTCFNLSNLKHDLLVTTSRSSRNDIFIEGKRDKGNQKQQVYNCTDCSHRFRSSIAISRSILPRYKKCSRAYVYISGRPVLAMSFPFSPAFTNTGLSHLIRLNVSANAIPLKAKDAIKGALSSSAWNMLARRPKQAPTRARRRQVSVRERADAQFIVEQAWHSFFFPNENKRIVPSS